MKKYAKKLFAFAILLLLASFFSLILDSQGVALRGITYSFLVALVGLLFYIGR